MAKRPINPNSASPSSPPTKRRMEQNRPFRITNIDDGEEVHQTCIAIHGKCQIFDSTGETESETSFISISGTDSFNQSQPVHHWPFNNGHWKALVMLVPGINKIRLELHHANKSHDSIQLTLNYVPLLQLPPLHLAILVARDSPLLIDCPPAKYGAVSSAHSGIEAAVAKLRMSAYMWQALTAEDFREKGLGRRTFRLEGEWGSNTTTRMNQHGRNLAGGMGTVAKVHIIQSEKSVAELRDAQVAQQNPRGRDRDALHKYFEAALVKFGGPFESRCRPVVAGMVLDAHYSVEQSLILGHAALGCHKADGISLGIFGSHLAYSWPRFLEEVPACLTDPTPTGDTVGNDNGECNTMRNACFVGQGAFLHEVGHAFGADHTTGIMARGYSKSWGMNFVEHDSNNGLHNDAKWDLRDVLRFKRLPHFALPGDEYPMSSEFQHATVNIEFDFDNKDKVNASSEGDDECDDILKVSCKAGLALVEIQNGTDAPGVHNFIEDGNHTTTFSINISTGFDRTSPLMVTALGMNGKEVIVKNAWALLNEKPYVSIPGSNVVLRKQSVRSDRVRELNDDALIPWAMLLHHRSKSDGQLHRATSIDLRVGCTMDGAVVYYADGTHENCGPVLNRRTGQPHWFGGHASQRRDLPEGETISKVVICNKGDGWDSLSGIRMTLSNGKAWGCLNASGYDGNDTDDDDDDEGDNDDDGEREEGESLITLKPRDDEVIVGFYGQSDSHCGFTYQFGILTAPKGIDLPEIVYDMPELSNA